MEARGLYDDVCIAARVTTNASTLAMLVVGGNRGSGFSVQTRDSKCLASLPELLRALADEVELRLAAQQLEKLSEAEMLSLIESLTDETDINHLPLAVREFLKTQS